MDPVGPWAREPVGPKPGPNGFPTIVAFGLNRPHGPNRFYGPNRHYVVGGLWPDQKTGRTDYILFFIFLFKGSCACAVLFFCSLPS